MAGTAITLYSLPIARREAQKKSKAMANSLNGRIQRAVAETSERARETASRIEENVLSHKQAIAESVGAAKQAYREALKPANQTV